MTRASWTAPADHPAFGGHFPGRPIVPGVVLLDRVVALVSESLGRTVTGVANVKFLKPVGPGETVDFSWTVNGRSARFDIASGAAAVATGALNLAEPQ